MRDLPKPRRHRPGPTTLGGPAGAEVGAVSPKDLANFNCSVIPGKNYIVQNGD